MKIIRSTEQTFTSNSYIIITAKKNAVIIDPNSAESIVKMIGEHQAKVVYILLTHEHYDHVCGLGALKAVCPETILVASKACSRQLPQVNVQKERFRLYLHYMGAGRNLELPDCDLPKADREFADKLELELDDCIFSLKSTPGHSPGSISIVLNERYLFAGDSVLPGKDVVVKFSGGDKAMFEREAKPYFMGLTPHLIVLPGHGNAFLLGKKQAQWLSKKGLCYV